MGVKDPASDRLFTPLQLPCGVVLKNRIAKAAMSDSLGDGRGDPTEAQCRLYERWAEGGAALSIIGEVQPTPDYPEKPGNLVLAPDSGRSGLRTLVRRGSVNGAGLWVQLGHAGAMAHPPISSAKGPSALDLPGLVCGELTTSEVINIPEQMAEAARLAKDVGFGGVEIHAAHGFLLSQFLSPLFNRRGDAYGGDLTGRMRLTLEVVEAVRAAVGSAFPVAIKLNATDQLEGGFEERDALDVVAALDQSEIDLIDISGGTYFPGAQSSSDRSASGPYFLDFAQEARTRTRKPLMTTGGFKTRAQAESAVASGATDLVGLARAFALVPDLANRWRSDRWVDPQFPRFTSPPEGGVTAWYSMRLTALGEDRSGPEPNDLVAAIEAYEKQDAARAVLWNARFGRFGP